MSLTSTRSPQASHASMSSWLWNSWTHSSSTRKTLSSRNPRKKKSSNPVSRANDLKRTRRDPLRMKSTILQPSPAPAKREHETNARKERASRNTLTFSMTACGTCKNRTMATTTTKDILGSNYVRRSNYARRLAYYCYTGFV